MMFLMSYNRLRKLLLLVTTSYAPQICINKLYSHSTKKGIPPYMAKPFFRKKKTRNTRTLRKIKTS